MSDGPTQAPFALCLSHDVDRVRQTFQPLYYALTERNFSHLRSLLAPGNSYWQFDDIMALEDDLGVRSSFYFLDEKWLFGDKPPWEWLHVDAWKRYTGRYDVDSPAVADVMRRLDDGGWEVGLHGSYDSYTEPDRLEREKARIEAVLDHPVSGTRQHYLNLDVPETWRHHRRIGLAYDASLGSRDAVGFQHGYEPFRPFGDDFVVFPLTAMEVALVGDRGVEAAWVECERLLDEAESNGAVMTVLWHQRYFSEREFPGYRGLYRRLIEAALDRGAWVGPLGEYYRAFVADGRAGSASDREPGADPPRHGPG